MASDSRNELPVAASGRVLVAGSADAELVFTDVPISLWMGVDVRTGCVMDQHHPLLGVCLNQKIVALPGGRGSCAASGALIELLLNGVAPAGFIFQTMEEILALGALLAQTFFDKTIPLILVDDPNVFSLLRYSKRARIQSDTLYVDNDLYLLTPASSDIVTLTTNDREMLEGRHGNPAATMAMKVIVAFAAMQKTSSLIDVSQVHIDACCYVGMSSILIPRKLHEMGARFAVPSTCNSLDVDQQRWRDLGANPEISQIASDIGDLYVAMGSTASFTCAPYVLETRPAPGEQVAWSESNAVVFANSVLGARTQKYPDYLDVMIALTSRAPYAGCHKSGGRLPQVLVTVPDFSNWDDSLFPLLGYCIGEAAGNKIPFICGLEHSQPTLSSLKAFSTAFATTSSAPMFHMNNITAEAKDLSIDQSLPHVFLKTAEIQEAWKRLNTATTKNVDLVSLGNPHFSLDEFASLARLCEGRMKGPNVKLIVTTGRDTYAKAAKSGYLEVISKFGGSFITDTCWCMIQEPVIPVVARTIMTNSAKYAHYGPGVTHKEYHFGSLAGCVDAACTGERRDSDARPEWLFGTSMGKKD